MLKDINNLKKDLQEYLLVQLDLIKLDMAEKLSRFVFNIANIAIVGSLVFFILLFSSFAAGYFFATHFNSNVIGFLIISFFYSILLLIYLIFRKKIVEQPIIKAIVTLFFSKRTK